MSTADAARASFESFVRRWQQCDGVSVVKRPWGQTKSEIDAVSLAITPRGEGQPTAPTPAVRLVRVMLDKVE